jgi:hypothetical protein
MKLSKKAADEISSLINTIVVGYSMMEDSKIKSQWWKSVAQAYIKLEDEFGIDGPSNGQYRELLANGFFEKMADREEEARNAKEAA